VFVFGLASDKFVVGDWDGDGDDDIAVYRPSADGVSALFSLDSNGSLQYEAGIDQVFIFGLYSDTFVAGKWSAALESLASQPTAANGVDVLTMEDLLPIVAHAKDVWGTARTLTPSQLRALNEMTIGIRDLQAGTLGLTFGSRQVEIDINGDDDGWFIDPTPGTHEEFALSPRGFYRAFAGRPAAGHMDLLTVVLHEIGHVLGYDHVDPAVEPANVMGSTIPLNVRRLP
jgi:hypothetical protein